MMHPEPIMLTHEQHINEIMSLRQLARIDHVADEIMFEEDERNVTRSLMELELFPCEPRPRQPINWTIARDIAATLALNLAGIAFGGYVLFQMIR